MAAATGKLKLRWPDFTTIPRPVTLPAPTSESRIIAEAALQIFGREWGRRAVRLIGVGVSGLHAGPGQRSLFDAPDERGERLDLAMAALPARFGPNAIPRAPRLAVPTG